MAKKKNKPPRRKKSSSKTYSSRTPSTTGNPARSRFGLSVGVGIGLFVLFAAGYILQPIVFPDAQELSADSEVSNLRPTRFFKTAKLGMAWDNITPAAMNLVSTDRGKSNIAPKDYVGPDSCVECHQENYEHWLQHPHHKMNARATEASVLGDFSGDAQIQYRNGVGKFFRVNGEYRMRFEREDLIREYRITQTIGSRFHQYYVGVGLVGPEPKEHPYYREDHVLPFGYWIGRAQWVPIVHVHKEVDEHQRWESLEELIPPLLDTNAPDEVSSARGVSLPGEELGLIYAQGCNYCHTTFPLGDMLIRMPYLLGKSLTEESVFELSKYVAATHPDRWDGSTAPEEFADEQLAKLTDDFIGFDAREKAATLGVSCEACHLGCREHTEAPEQIMPSFAPQHPNFHTAETLDTGRTPENLNAACARCHSGARPKFAAGMATWNSTEHADAMLGSCYSQLTCVHCHDPHKATGLTWTKSPEEDDASCIACHEQFREPELRSQHTHHPAGSAGDRCLNCHMPKINEGMQDVVRTHMIFSPTQADMLEANQPNACNLCHLDKGIDWTLTKLKDWYGREFDQSKIDAHYADRSEAVGVNWLAQKHAPTRLVAAEAIGKSSFPWALDSLLPLLDDDHLMNRQFTQTAVERQLGIDIAQRFGYWYFQQPLEREKAIAKLKQFLADQ